MEKNSKLLNGLSEGELRTYIERRKQELYKKDLTKYGNQANLVLNYRIYGIQQLEKEVNEYFTSK